MWIMSFSAQKSFIKGFSFPNKVWHGVGGMSGREEQSWSYMPYRTEDLFLGAMGGAIEKP